MATWEAVKSYLVSNYKCELIAPERLKLLFELDQGRSQVVIVSYGGPSPAEATWVDFHSPIGDLDKVNLNDAVRATIDFVGGGISSVAGLATLRASVPLENLDTNEIEEPLRLVCLAGDELELRLTGEDVY